MKLSKLAFWLYVITILTGLVGYSLRILLARNLSVADYGLFYAVYSFIFFFAPFRDLGLGEATIYFTNKYLVKKNYSNLKTIAILGLVPQIILGIIFSIVFIVLSDYLSIHVFKAAIAKPMIIAFSILFAFQTIVPTLSQLFLALHEVLVWKLSDLLKMSLFFVITLALFQFNKTPLVPTIARVVGTIIVILLLFIYFLVKYKNIVNAPFNNKEWKKLLKEMIKYGIPITLSTAAGILLVYSDIILLTLMKGNESVGYYNIALPIRTLFSVLLGPIANVMYPKIAKWHHEGNKRLISKVLYLLYNYSLVFLLPFSIIFFAFPKLVIKTLFGEKYIVAYLAVKIFSVGVIFLAIRNINFSILGGIGKPATRSKIVFIGAIINVILDLILIHFFDYNGAALATVIGYFVMALLTMKELVKEFKIFVSFEILLKTAFAGVIFYFSILFFRKILEFSPLIEAIVVTTLSLIVYVIVLYILRVITRERLKLFLKYININISEM